MCWKGRGGRNEGGRTECGMKNGWEGGREIRNMHREEDKGRERK